MKREAIIKLKSITNTTFGKFHQTQKEPGELSDAYERRTWKEKAHYDEHGFVKIPGTMIANCIRESARFMSLQIPGKGKATFTKHFDAGIIVYSDIVTKISKKELQGDTRHVPSDGRAGGTKRVLKIFPILMQWEGEITVIIGDDIITPDVLEDVVRNAGNLIGIGTWRPKNRGMNGRFELIDMKWIE
ncbi:MAG: hypothetical protein ABJA71_08125 [Ginsengibacter sp.]